MEKEELMTFLENLFCEIQNQKKTTREHYRKNNEEENKIKKLNEEKNEILQRFKKDMKRIKNKKQKLVNDIYTREGERVRAVESIKTLENLMKKRCKEQIFSDEDLYKLIPNTCSICFQHGIPVGIKTECKCILNVCLICANYIYKLNPDQTEESRNIKCIICKKESFYSRVPFDCFDIDWQHINLCDFFLTKSTVNFLACGKCSKPLKTYKGYLEHLQTECYNEHTMCYEHNEIYIRILGCPKCLPVDEEKKEV